MPVNLLVCVNKDIALLQKQCRNGIEARNIKKLARLHGCKIKLPTHQQGFISLVLDLQFTVDQEELSNFGFNCHYICKPH